MDEILADGRVPPVMGGLHVVEAAGHTPGHISFFTPSASVLFVGDSLVSEETGLHGLRRGQQLGPGEGRRRRA